MKNIHHLLDRYFEGNTSTAEEEALRRYFSQEELPEELQEIAPLFRFMDDEATARAVLKEIEMEANAPARRRPRLLDTFKAIAAVAAVLLLAVLLETRPAKQPSTQVESYAWVDGQQITDPATVQKYAEVSFGKIKSDRDMVEEQLSFMLE